MDQKKTPLVLDQVMDSFKRGTPLILIIVGIVMLLDSVPKLLRAVQGSVFDIFIAACYLGIDIFILYLGFRDFREGKYKKDTNAK